MLRILLRKKKHSLEDDKRHLRHCLEIMMNYDGWQKIAEQKMINNWFNKLTIENKLT